MAKRLTKEEKINQAVVDLINEMFKIAGYNVTYDDIKDRKDDWYAQWTMTEQQYDEWKRFGENYLKTKLKYSQKTAKMEMAFFGLNYGLRFDKYPGLEKTEK
jgi:hypothetical protein